MTTAYKFILSCDDDELTNEQVRSLPVVDINLTDLFPITKDEAEDYDFYMTQREEFDVYGDDFETIYFVEKS